ncbi:MAG: 3-oxoacyl-[acyl-carrier-protein] synthase 2 [Phycisphaerae bacterium]|nr:3-oxoacyl-[acyl-carrier-protein] synthase 2 [Phycisphaerae bacterium]
MSDRRVVITGLGAVTPLGASVPAFWDGLISSRCGVRSITHFDASPFDVRFGGTCSDFDPSIRIDRRMLKRMDPCAQFAVAAAAEAVEDSGLDLNTIDLGRAGVILGSGIGGLLEIEEQIDRLRTKGPDKVSAFTIPKLMVNASSGHISIRFGFQGISTAVSTACASATNAMVDAVQALRRGEADVVITGGTEAALTPLGLAAFAAMKALSTRNGDPARASRPFDRDRDGFVMAEGAGILVFEDYEHARRRGARIYCEVVGAGVTSDAFDMVQPDESGRGAARAMQRALAYARLNTTDVQYINAHATSTPLGDAIESQAIQSVFGAHARKLAVSSTKGATGHLLGASGGVEMIACVLAIRHSTLPPTINLENPDPRCELDYVANHARDARVSIVMNNSFGFGGHNGCLIVKSI